MIERSLVQIPAPGKAELYVEVSLILNPTLLISEGPAMTRDGIGSSSNTP